MAKQLETKNAMQIFMEDSQKNVTTTYDVLNTYIHEIDSGAGEQEPVQIDLLIDIPKNVKIRFTPNSAELTVKFLIQYIALLIPAWYIFFELWLGWGFRRNLLRSKVVSEIKHAVDFSQKRSLIKYYN